MSVSTTFRGYKITATYTGSKPAQWGDKQENWNHHRVTVSKESRRVSFDFWASMMHPELRSRSDLLGAFECFLSDAISGKQDFEEFCSELGYDSDSRKAEKAWKACCRSADKAERLLSSDDLYNLANALSTAQEKEAA